MRSRIVLLAALTLALVALLGGAAYADTAADNAQCLTCHGTSATTPYTKVDFGVPGAVDRSTACNKCHWYAGHPHQYDSSCGTAGCHWRWSVPTRTADTFYYSGTSTTSGWFSSADSLNLTPAELHEIHLRRSWPADIRDEGCSSCHASAACDACHTSTVNHGDHGVSGDSSIGTPTETVSAQLGRGTPLAVLDHVDHSTTEDNSCGASSCHAGLREQVFIDDESTQLTYSGVWTTAASTGLGGSATASSLAGDAVQFTFTGTQFTWIGERRLDGGIAQVWVDGVMRFTRDTRWSYTRPNAALGAVYDLAAGTHTVRIVNTGTKSPYSTGTYISVQGFDTRNTPAALTAVPACTNCHDTADEHYGAARHTSSWAPLVSCGGVGCHDASGNLVTVHEEHRTAAEGEFTCAGCHSNFSVALQIEQGLTGCSDCHGGISALTGHRDLHAAVPQLRDPVTNAPNYSYYTGSAGTAPTGDCAGCHTSNLVDEHMGLYLGGWVTFPRHDSTGAALTCGSCHDQPEGSTVQMAIGSSLSSCESCHTVHGPMQAVHASTFVDEQSVPCADCHSANLADEHNGGYTSSAGLTGCDVCHELYAGDFGATVQSAISVTNDTRCSACHATYHTDSTAHEAASAESVACTACHDEGGTTVIDITAIHAGAGLGPCKVCHANTARVPDINLETAECASCHDTEGADGNYHVAMSDSHTFSAMDESCASCHPSTLPEAHAAYLSRYPEYDTTCDLCHDNADPARIPAGATANCDDCHDIHGDITELHTATESDGCVRCHDSADLRVLHADTPEASCATCHNTSLDLAGKTAECASCHVVSGTDYHSAMDGSHTFTAMSGTCTQVGCHTNTLPEEHAKYLSRYTGYADACALCHLNASSTRIDWSTASADCSTCHTVHGDIDALHGTTASQACVACHEYTDVRDLHGTSREASCAVCHSAAAGRINWDPATVSIECTYCHGTYAQIDPSHYPVTTHDASAETACNQCHYKDMKTEHFLATVSPTVTCVSCHELKVDGLTTAWTKTCADCHPTNHGDRNTKHISTTTGCSGAGCHDITDVSKIHQALSGGGCGACHVSPAARATTTTCTAAGCHASIGTNHHEAHNGASVNPTGCAGCHNMYLDDEHAALGYTCATCHDSTVTAVVNAIAAGDLRCKSCHPTMHSRQNYEFNPNMAGGHRVSADLPGMQSSFVVNGATYTWSLPTASSFLKTGWTTSSIVPCDGCHTYSGATGPHGATMRVNIDPAYPTSWKTAYLGGTTSGILCYKCHQNLTRSNSVHSEDDHHDSSNGKCIACHIQVPHGWGRPRLLGTTSDPAPYTSTKLIALQLRNYTPSGWSESNCYASCEDHESRVSVAWPAVGTVPAPTTGTVSGTVATSSGTAVSGATVTVSSKTATTATNGTYTIADLTAGAYAMTVSATGYATWTGSVTVTAGGTLTQNVTLTPTATTSTNIARTGTASASSTPSSSYAASKAIDGSTSTYWRSNGGWTEWLRVDLGGTKTLSSAVVNWNSSYYARSYRIETSTDGSNWTTRYSTTSGNGGIDTITLTSVSARYVRVYCTNANSSSYRVNEFEVWGY